MKTFKEVANEVINRCESGLSTRRQHVWLLERLARLHPLDIATLGAPDLFAVLEQIGESTQTARRAKMLVGRTIRYAIAKGYRHAPDFAADMRGVLLRVAPTKSRAAIVDPAALGGLLRAIDTGLRPSPVRNALRLAAHVFVRPSELRSMRWEEVDFARGEWIIPAAKTKMRREHVVPLSRQASAILWNESLADFGPEGGFVFPGRGKGMCLSENMLTLGLRRLMYGPDEMSGHGFRATASTLLGEMGVERDLVELQLAHLVGSGTRRAYDRALRLEERAAMMQRWSDRLDALRADGGGL